MPISEDNRAVRAQPLIAVRDVEASAQWYAEAAAQAVPGRLRCGP